MAKKPKYWKKEKGVSPVIATILMVAITVVLASAVYLMVSGYIGTSPSKPASLAITPQQLSNATELLISGGNISLSSAHPLIITISGGNLSAVVTFTISGNSNYGGSSSSTTPYVKYWVYAGATGNSNYLAGGDYILLGFTSGGSIVE
ncbi:MAG: archaellin/type IV pilin N-terminal domain-containing protein, partial [Thermoplasmata archaeon]